MVLGSVNLYLRVADWNTDKGDNDPCNDEEEARLHCILIYWPLDHLSDRSGIHIVRMQIRRTVRYSKLSPYTEWCRRSPKIRGYTNEVISKIHLTLVQFEKFRISFSQKTSRLALETTQSPIHWLRRVDWGVLSPEMNRPGREAHNSP